MPNTETSGADVKRQVMDYLFAALALDVRADLALCVVLTVEEAAKLRAVILDVPGSKASKAWSAKATEALALLAPETEAGE